MRFPTPLVPGRLIRRYKRFLADVRLEDGRAVVAHCPSPGSMMGLAEPGLRVWLEPNVDPRKKLDYGWRLVEHADGHFTAIDTALPNRMLKGELAAGAVAGLEGYGSVRAEVPYGQGSRVDFVLGGEGRRDCFVEVKCVTLSRRPGVAEFPDAVTARGARHMSELAQAAQAGHRAVLLFLVQRTDAAEVRVAADIDPAYAAAVAAAQAAGVEVFAHAARITPQEMALGPQLPFRPG